MEDIGGSAPGENVRMSARGPQLAALLALVLAACPGGRDEPPASRLGGVVTFQGGHVADGDVADPAAPYHPNDTVAQAQAVAATATVGGWVGAGADDLDWYAAALAAGQSVAVTVVEPAAGVEVCLRDARAPEATLQCVLPAGENLSIDVPAAGDYLVSVEALSGDSNYLLEFATGPAPQGRALRLSAEFVPGDVLVTFRRGGARGDAPAKARAAAAELGLELEGGDDDGPALLRARGAAARANALRRLGLAPLAVEPGGAALDPVLDEKRETMRLIAGLRARADVATADPNYVFHPTFAPTDALYRYQWHYAAIRLPQAWDLETGAPASGQVVVAVVDTGVFLAHPDLAGQLTKTVTNGVLAGDGYDFISDAAAARDGDGIDPNPDDPGDSDARGDSSYHGTHVAGTIVARTSDAGTATDARIGGAGVAFGAKVMPLRALGVNGGTSSDIVRAVRYAARLGSGPLPSRRADVVNLSLGCLDCYSATEEQAYAQVRDQGVIVVAASGNDGRPATSYPASYPGVVSVGGITSATTTTLASYSDTGPTVDVVAPGGDGADRNGDGRPDLVVSTWVNDSSGTRQAAYAGMAGTSMATPHVAGVAALMKAACPTLGPAQLDLLLQSGKLTTPVGAQPRNDSFGHGLVDARKSVEAALAACGEPVPPTFALEPARLAFAPSYGEKLVTLAKTGGDAGTTLAVTKVETTAPWLTVAPVTADTDGFGGYRVTVSRTGLADGAHAASVVFTGSSGVMVPLPVTVLVSPVAEQGGGHVYVALLRCDGSGDPFAIRDEDAGNAGGSGFRFEFPFVPDGAGYCLLAGTDDDNDGFICDAGEACSTPADQPLTTFDLAGDELHRDLEVAYEAALPPAEPASEGPLRPQAGVRRRAAAR